MFPLTLPNKCSLSNPNNTNPDSKTLKCTRNKESGITGLIHNTGFNNIIQILSSGYIKTGKELQEEKVNYNGINMSGWDYGDQANGVYMTYLTHNTVGMKWKDSKCRAIPALRYNQLLNVSLVFSTVLLERNDYIINLDDQNGYILKNTYTPFNLDSMNISQGETLNEIVFPTKVSLDYLQAIWIVGETEQGYNVKRDELRSLLTQAGNDIYDKFNPLIIPYSTIVPDKVYDKGCNDQSEIKYLRESSLKPNYCNAIHPRYDGVDDDYNRMSNKLEIYQKIARNCGYNEKEISNKSVMELRGMINEVEIKRYKDPSIITPTIYYPPFK